MSTKVEKGLEGKEHLQELKEELIFAASAGGNRQIWNDPEWVKEREIAKEKFINEVRRPDISKEDLADALVWALYERGHCQLELLDSIIGSGD